MADSEVTKRTKTANNSDVDMRKQDKLSYLPDEILIEIISFLPINLAIATGSLSRRWRSLWTNVTSICIDKDKYLPYTPNFLTQITSSSIDTFSVEIDDTEDWISQESLESWLQLICDRNVREFKLTNGRYSIRDKIIQIPRFIFETQSLVSLKLCYYKLGLFNIGGLNRFNLPNLKYLELKHSPTDYSWLGKLIAACPSLEDLILICRANENHKIYRVNFNCSNQNLRRLFINIFMNKGITIVINAPKLEHLGVRALNPVTLRFGEEPVLLREEKIVWNGYGDTQLEDENNVASEFYGAIGNIKSLALDFFKVDIASTVFRNVTRLTFNMKTFHNLNTLLLLLKKFPVLDVLTLKFASFHTKRSTHKRTNRNTLQRVLKRINIETSLKNYSKTTRSFLELVRYLLSGAIDLKHFHFTVIRDSNWTNLEDEHKRELKLCKEELKLCKLLYQSPMVSMGSNIEFVGLVLNMSGKDGPKAWKNNGKCIPFY